MSEIYVTTRDGAQHIIDAPEDVSLMETLRDHNLDVEGVCGGTLSCASCHIYLGEDWLDKIGAAEEFESVLLDELVQTKPTSRLCCQMLMTAAWRGLRLTVAPPEA